MDATPTHEDWTSRVWYLRTAASSGGEVHEQRVEYLPCSPFPPTHFHPAQDEHFEVESGEMLFVVAGEKRLITAGYGLDNPSRYGTPGPQCLELGIGGRPMGDEARAAHE